MTGTIDVILAENRAPADGLGRSSLPSVKVFRICPSFRSGIFIMVVRSDCRGHSIGRRLLQHALNEARMAGCTRITLLTDDDSHKAMRLYAGFERSARVPLRLKL